MKTKRLEDLVPHRKLCELIPSDDFQGSALIWYYDGCEWWVNAREFDATPDEQYSAPTSDELLEALRDVGVLLPSIYTRKCEDGWTWVADGEFPQSISERQVYRDSWGLTDATDMKNPATALLKLWFKWKGIAYA